MMFIPYLILLAAVVAFICLGFARKGAVHRGEAEEKRRRSLEQQQRRFYQQQSWMFWHDFFNGRNRR